MQKHKQLKLSSDCHISKGYNRTAIFKLSDSQHWFIPNVWGELLMKPTGINLDDLPKKLVNSTDFEIENDLMFLFKNQIITLDDHLELEDIEYNENILNNFKPTCSITLKKPLSQRFLTHINVLNMGKLELYFRGNPNIIKCLNSILTINFDSIELYLTYRQINRLNFDEIINQLHSQFSERIERTIIYVIGTPFTYTERYRSVLIKKYKTFPKHEIHTEPKSRIIAEDFHSYYKHRIHLTTDGAIYNSPFTQKKFGNMFQTSLSKIYESADFRELWNVKKNMTDVCSDCEFRSVCNDRRIINKRKNGTWYSNESCSYNPYLCTFSSDFAFRSLEECGIQSTARGFKIFVDQFIQVKSQQPELASPFVF